MIMLCADGGRTNQHKTVNKHQFATSQDLCMKGKKKKKKELALHNKQNKSLKTTKNECANVLLANVEKNVSHFIRDHFSYKKKELTKI